MRVKIIGDGTLTGTKIIDADTGERIKDVKSVTFCHDGGDLPRVYLEFVCPEVELKARVGDELPVRLEDQAVRYKSARAAEAAKL